MQIHPRERIAKWLQRLADHVRKNPPAEEPRNGGHRYAIQATDGVYCWADAVRLDPISGEPEWICDRGDHTELKKKLPGWGILVDLKPEMTVEEFRQGKR